MTGNSAPSAADAAKPRSFEKLVCYLKKRMSAARGWQKSHADIAANITPFDRVLQSHDVASRMLDATTPHGAAVLDEIVNHQAQIIAYNGDFRLMSLVVVPPLLLLLVMRRHRRPVAPVAAAAEARAIA